ncbi:Bacteriophage lambda, GpH, tail tape measure, C-terminal [uncultured Caudovirales phage]|uniref:Bacteriophage lambda, GpH, tail tape measure, C-terminal n=1 Tax=uncultured Caudovirales phage TaxID=2100421 RepID=A0A6J7WC61_9CAUD|nr:Bacteriophage lambda, GpH, tail tape measure, C-terminal [uncultured Caudovirales phage]
MANMIARLGVLLGLDSAEFNKGLADAGRKLEQFSNAAVTYGNIAATALTAASVAALKYADELADVAQANDVAIATVIKLSDALANAGGKSEDSAKLLAGFTKFIDSAAEGSLQAQQHLAKMGVSLKDVGNLSTEELLYKVVKNIAAIEDPLTRSARGMEIFGKAAKGVDFVEVADRMAQTTKLTEEQAQAIKDAAEMHDLLAQGARNTTLILATQLGPILKTTIGYIQDMSSDGNLLGNTFKTVFQTIAILGANVYYVLKGMKDEVVAMYDFVENLATKNLATAIAKNDEYVKKTIEARLKLDEFEKRIMNPDNGMGRFDQGAGDDWEGKSKKGGRPTVEAKQPEREKLLRHFWELMKKGRMEELRVIEETNKALGEQEDIYRKGAISEMQRLNLFDRQLERQQEIFNLSMRGQNMRGEDLQLAQDLLQIEYRRQDNIEAINKNESLTRERREESLQRENELAQKAIELSKQRNMATRGMREGTFGEGVEKGMGKFIRDLPTELENGQRAFESVIGNMEQALNNFVKTGKLSFKDLARSIIQDIIAIQLRAQASGFLSMLIGSFTNPGANGASGNGTGVTGFGSAYADGGSPTPNTVNLVGERGPELFIPKTAGTIIPNNALSGMGGTTNVTNYNINAIDTKSFEDRLLGSSTAVWAANQYGAKSLATNYGRT